MALHTASLVLTTDAAVSCAMRSMSLFLGSEYRPAARTGEGNDVWAQRCEVSYGDRDVIVDHAPLGLRRGLGEIHTSGMNHYAIRHSQDEVSFDGRIGRRHDYADPPPFGTITH
jgi:hypothetical protein